LGAAAAHRRSLRWGVAATLIGLLILAYWLRRVLLPFVFAAAIAYVTTPLVRLFRRKTGLPRWIGAVLVFIGILCLFAAAGYWVYAVLIPEAHNLGKQLPDLLRELMLRLFGKEHVTILGQEVGANYLVSSGIAAINSWIGGPMAVIAGGFAAAMLFFLTLVLLFFFLISGPKLGEGALWLVPPTLRDQARQLARRINPVLIRYILGVFIVAVTTIFLSWVGTGLLLGLPHALILSVAVGFLELLPVIGPIISATLLAVIAVSSGKVGVIIGVALFALAIRLFIDQLMAPIIIGRAVVLHPVIIIFSLMVGGVLFGILGVLLAVPAAAACKIALQSLYERDEERILATGIELDRSR
jgi:predicted PurR-regulated permease PerM